jgi:hypothetical protein
MVVSRHTPVTVLDPPHARFTAGAFGLFPHGFRRQLSDIRRDPPRLVFGEQLGGRTPGWIGSLKRNPLNPHLTHCGTVPALDGPHMPNAFVKFVCIGVLAVAFSRMLVNLFTARGASGPRVRSVDLAPSVINHLRGFASTTLTPARPRFRVSPPSSALAVQVFWQYSPRSAAPRLW